MNIDWFYFVIALVLLWLPRQVLRFGGKVTRSAKKRRSVKDTNPATVREPGDPSVSFLAEIRKLRNFVDFFRAGIGSAILVGAFGLDAVWSAAEGATEQTQTLVEYGRAAVLLVGVVVQMFRFETRVTLFPPIFYLSGLTFALCGFYPALFALVLIWVINFALPNPSAFLSIYGLLAMTFGLLFQGLEDMLPFVAAFLMLLPVIVSLLMRRRLVLLTKRPKLPSSGMLA